MVLPSISTVISLAVAYGLLLALLRRPWTAGGITVYLVAFALLSSFVKQAYLGMAVTLADMRFFLMRPLENFKLFLAYPLLGATLGAVLLGVALFLVVGLKFERPIRLFSAPRVGAWLRAATAAGAALLGLGASLIGSHESQAPASDGDAYAAFLSMYEQQHPGGLMSRLNIFFNNRSFAASIPTRRAQHRFASPAGAIPIPAAAQRPDILLVLEESTFDTTLIRDCPRVCDFEILHAPPSAVRTQQGPLLVHTTGGGTWLAEFAVLSGFDWRVFGRGGAFAPISLAPRLQRSLPKHFRDLGYRTIAIYPTDGNFLSAQTAYDHYGFDEFHERRSLGLPDEWGDTRDAMVFAKALAAAHRDDHRPVFVFVLTIRNHGPHGYHPEMIPKKFAEAAQRTSVPLADFLARMSDSSSDYAALAKQWLAVDRPRVIAWFGDHQPEAAWDFTQHAEKLQLPRIPANVGSTQWQYLTHYQMSANFGRAAVQESHDALDLAYLGGELLKFADLPLDAGSLAAGEVASACHGLFIDCADRDLINDYLSYRIHDLRTVD